MTIKKRLFLSNLFMLLIPALVSILVVAVSALLFLNLFFISRSWTKLFTEKIRCIWSTCW